MSALWEGVKRFFVFRLTPPALIKSFAHPYISGDSMESAIRLADSLHQGQSLQSTIDVLGEEVSSEAEARAYTEVYLGLIRGLGERRHATISLKPTAMGLRLGEGLAAGLIDRVVGEAARSKVGVTIDMEDHTLTDATLKLHRRLREQHGMELIGTVLQSRLFRTAADVEALSGLPSRIRLCLGIYREPGTIAWTDKRRIKENFLVLLERLAAGGHFVEVATHDEALVVRSRELLERLGVPRERIEFQMLLGVPRGPLQARLVAAGYPVRLYVPFALRWADAIAYCRRRMVENPSMAAMVLGNLFSPQRQGAAS